MKAGERAPRRRQRIVDAGGAAIAARPFVNAEQETFVVLCIDIRHGLMCDPAVVAIGTVSCVEVHPRDVFREAIRQNAVAIVLVHNHPSGDATPSDEDVELTKRLLAVSQIVGIPIVDHVVLGDDCFVSIAERRPDGFKR